MATINAVAHLNELTTDITDDYYLTPQVTATLDVPAIIERLKAREIATKNVDGAAFVQTILDECATASAEGNNVVTSFFRSSIGIKGAVRADELGHNIPAEKLKVSVNLTQGEGARKAVEGSVIYAFEQAGATGPVIQSVTDPTVGKSATLYIGGMVLIEGMRLSLKGDDPSVGIHFKKVGGSETADVSPKKVWPNTPTKLQFSLPAAVTEGQWTVSVTTQASSSGTILTKPPRTSEFQTAVTVTTEGGDSESPDEI